jgi:hypothetical protein
MSLNCVLQAITHYVYRLRSAEENFYEQNKINVFD